jgi:UDP-N-acetylglucosamine acyltransferase
MGHIIHPTAVIADGATIGNNISIGPYCVVGSQVTLGDNVILKSHVVIDGKTSIGSHTEIYPFASIGLAPQDRKFGNEPSELIIGSHNIIREYTTMNPGTQGGGMVTRVGDHCLFMVSTHVAHDCIVGNHVIMANNATLAGHVQVGDHAVLGGLSAVHQFVRIGQHAMIGGMSAIESDVIPYGLALGERAHLAGLNLVGLKRRGFDKEAISRLRSVYKTLFAKEDGRTFDTRIQQTAAEFKDDATVISIIDFLRQDTSRAICQPKG